MADDRGMTKQRRQPFAAKPIEATPIQGAPAAFDSVRDEIAAVPASALAPINLEIPPAARRGLVVAERLAPLMPEFALLYDLDLRAIGKLQTYALALLHAQALVDLTEREVTPLSALVAEATPLRANLLATAEMLAHFGLVSAERLAGIHRRRGFAALADDLLTLALLLRGAWDRVKDKVCVTRADVERAVSLSGCLHKALGTRESEVDPLIEPCDPRFVRAQAYTLFVRAYAECRRAVTYLRWHQGDVRRIVPSLRPRRTSRTSVVLDAVDGASNRLEPGGASEPANGPMPASSESATEVLAGA